MSNVNNLVSKTTLNTKVTEIESKIPNTFDNPEFKILTKINFVARIIKT